MGWSWEKIEAYGFKIKPRGTALKSILDKNKKLIDYLELDFETVFLFFVSSFQTLDEADGSYAFSSPDVVGSPFNEPKHPTFTEFLDDNSYNLSEEEKAVLDKIRSELGLEDIKLLRVVDARVCY